jgi:hypothetical protein
MSNGKHRMARRRQEREFGRRLVEPRCESRVDIPGLRLRELRECTHCRDLFRLAWNIVF